jgi:hypothetical protein
MKDESNPNPRAFSSRLPDWADCEVFCIHDYAGAAAAPCGWRGRVCDARRDGKEMNLLCPRCGQSTLLRIPRSDSE